MRNDCKYFAYTSAGYTKECIIRDLGYGMIEYIDLDSWDVWHIKTDMPKNEFQADMALHGLAKKFLYKSGKD